MKIRKFDIDAVIAALEEHFYSVKTPIVDLIQAKTRDPFKVLVATILSARTKDETTAKVVNILFQKVNTPVDLEKISLEELDRIIFQTGFHNTKAKHLKELPRVLKEKFGGRIPSEIDELVQLPGVGRKTANLVRAVAFSLPAICVDIHVHRITNRWAYVQTKSPFETEMSLRKILPQKYWLVINSYLVAFGQNLCTPRNPKCRICPIQEYCAKMNVRKSD
ncbi:MAG: endonuclease III [Candidatus Cloacimonetes bacterium]|nr:endonuclease III [Candidatus Cloacimonadota bacterium]